MRRVNWASVAVGAALFSAVGPGPAPPPTARAADPAKPAPLAHYFPRQGLVAYAEFEGFDAHAGAWRKTASYRLLTETAAGAMLSDLATRVVELGLSTAPGRPMSADDFRSVVAHGAGSGFAVGVVIKPEAPQPGCLGLVIRGAAKGKIGETIEKVVGAGREGGAGKPWATVDKPGGRKLFMTGGPGRDGLAWWREGDDLAFSLTGQGGADLMIEALDDRKPAASAQPTRASLARTGGGFTPIGLAFLDPSWLPAGLVQQYAQFGLDKVNRIEYGWGVQGDAVMTVTRVAAPAPRTGLLALFDQATFDRKGLPPLPPGLAGLSAFSIDPVGLYDRVVSGIAATADPATRNGFDAFEAAVRERTGNRLRDDILSQLGPRVAWYTVPARTDAPTNVLAGLAQGALLTPESVVVIEVKDVKAFARVLDDSVTKLGESARAQGEAGARPPALRVRPLKGVDHGHVLAFSPGALPLPAGVKPTFALGKKCLIIAATPEAARKALALEAKGGDLPAGDPLARTVGALPGGMLFVHLSDARRSLLPELVANLPVLIRTAATRARPGFGFVLGGPRGPMGGRPFRLDIDPDHVPAPDDLRPFLFPSVYALSSDADGFQFATREAFPALNPAALAPVAAAFLLPAVSSARSAARRAQSVNNLKQIGLAMHNYHSVNNQSPVATTDKKGKPLLSWRVALLPYLEQQALYNEFKLDEPWDSPNNKPLIARMPPVFAIPGGEAEPGKTFYRGFSGESTAFDPKVKEGVGIQTVTDGTSNTIGVVEAKTAVVWTKPGEEIPFEALNKLEQARDLLRSVGGHFPGGFNALFLDGSVRFIKETINFSVMRAVITRNGGEVVSADAF